MPAERKVEGREPEKIADQTSEKGPEAEPKGKERPRYVFEDIRLEVDPERIDESIRSLREQLKRLVDQGRYTKVRLKYKGRPLMPDVPFGVFVATEAVAFLTAGLLSAVVMNLGVRTFIDVEFIHDADEKVKEGIDFYMEGEVERAEECYREALRMKQDDTSALYNLGVLLRVAGRREEAVACLEKAAADLQHPDGPKARDALERMKRGPRAL
jgi:tetratricopeptide (TPR) repeat protein